MKKWEKRMHKYSLQKKIFILSLFFMLIPLIAFTAFNIFTSVKKVEENYRSSLIFGMKKNRLCNGDDL